MRILRLTAFLAVLAGALSCAPAPETAPAQVSRVAPPPMPVARWDHHPRSDEWTAAALAAFQEPLKRLADRCRALGAEITKARFGDVARVLAPYEPSLAALPGVAELPEPPSLTAGSVTWATQVWGG